MRLENGKDLNERETNFKFPDEFIEGEGNNPEIIEIDREGKFELEITKEVIDSIREQMDRERKIGVEKLMRKLEKDGRTPEEKELKEAEIEGSQSLTFEAAALAGLSKEFPELNIGAVELSEKDIEISKKRLESDIAKAAVNKRRDGEKKELTAEQTEGLDEQGVADLRERIIQDMIASEQVWITEFQKSYLKDIMGQEGLEKAGLALTDKEWGSVKEKEGMVNDLKVLIGKKDWHNVIPRAGHMHNLDPERFQKDVIDAGLFSKEDEDGLLWEINVMKKGNPGEKREKRQKPDPWELASRIRYVAEFMPKLKSRIELDEEDWGNMDKHYTNARDKKNEGEDAVLKKGEVGDHWTTSYQGYNMKKIEKMIKNGEIKKVEAEKKIE